MKTGDIFYSVMQKDNNPFEKPRITKFIVEKIDTAHSYPIVSTKTDKWGRHYAFRESQIHLNYEDALVEKKKIIARIEKWEEEKREQDRLYFEEQERKEKQRQLEHDKQVRKEVVEFIDKCMEIQYYSSRWINPDGTEFCADVGYVCEWWDEFKQKLLDQLQGEQHDK